MAWVLQPSVCSPDAPAPLPNINEAAETQATEHVQGLYPVEESPPTAETIPQQVSTTSAAFETQ